MFRAIRRREKRNMSLSSLVLLEELPQESQLSVTPLLRPLELEKTEGWL